MAVFEIIKDELTEKRFIKMIAANKKRMLRNTADFYPDYASKDMTPQLFKKLIYTRGAVLLRGAVDIKILEDIHQALTVIYEKYAGFSAAEIAERAASEEDQERDFWEQIKLSHIFDYTFKKLAGRSYYDIVRSSGLWNMAAKAWPEASLSESVACNSRRIDIGEVKEFWDFPIDVHVDAQYLYDEKFSINFWSPLIACGVYAPGLKVFLLGPDATKNYLQYNPAGYSPQPDDIVNMHKFKCINMKPEQLAANGLLKYMWMPKFMPGDVLAFTNFTMHASHLTLDMTHPRTSVEVRVDFNMSSRSSADTFAVPEKFTSKLWKFLKSLS